jgi:hypothetical protein
MARVLAFAGRSADVKMSWGMLGNHLSGRWCDRAALAGALVFALVVSGCGGRSLLNSTAAPAPAPAESTSSGPQWLRGEIGSFFAQSSDKGPQPVAGGTPDIECPYIEIRQGASTLTIGGGGDNTAMSLKYQGTFVRAARQCSVASGQMTMKVGVEGRIILGPAGGPGQVDVPLRIAVVDQSPAGMKPILTKLIHIPVAIQSATDSPSFAHVEDGLTFPLPSAAVLEHYIVYIGFDPLAVQTQEKHPKPKPKPKRGANPAPGSG